MKKLALTLAIVLGLSMTTFADGGGLFQRGNSAENNNLRDGSGPAMPSLPNHNLSDNQDATPIGTGIAVLSVLGAAYLVGKKRREE